MLDFVKISYRTTKNGVVEIYPKFIIIKTDDLMIRGGDFYAIWVEEKGLWSTDEQDALRLIDQELDDYAEKNKQKFDGGYRVLHMWDSESGMIDKWHHYCQKQMRDSFHMLDETIIFSNMEIKKEDYASKKLDYPLEEGSMDSYDKLMSTLYSEEERHKIEWAIGSIVNGDSKHIQKFLVLYGSAGTGKSTILNIIQDLFKGYYCVFDARALGSSSNSFALEAFKSNPLVAIQHDGDLSRIEDNTRLNSLVAHEVMTVNEKFKSTYSNRFKCFLFMGTNKPVKITDAKSGLIRRLIDVSPTGNTVPTKEYNTLVKRIKFELGAIAYHCKEVYEEDPDYYDDYVPIRMLGASNDFYNFVLDSYSVFEKENGTTLKAAWEMYKTYCDDAKVGYPLPQRIFKEELKSYFDDYKERYVLEDGTRVRSYYISFKTDKFEENVIGSKKKDDNLIEFNHKKSLLDKDLADCPAQYASEDGKPLQKWADVTTKLKDLDTTKTHYVKVPKNYIVIDFDLRDENGERSLNKNIEEASKWPPTYAEISKSGVGVHLHYIYTGDVSELSRVYAEHIEIKVPVGNSSLRRKLTKCNDLPVAQLSGGLPLKGEQKRMVNFDSIKSEKGLRNMIIRNLNKEIHANTKPSIDFIKHILDEAYDSGMIYDVSDMHSAILAFAAGSTHQSEACIKEVGQMKFCSEKQQENIEGDNSPIIFYDIEVFKNLFIVCWKIQGEEKSVVKMINPTPQEVEELMKFKLVGFNCRRYDNHILYARLMGYTNEQLYKLSQKIIEGDKNCFFGEAYNVSYTDVYDFAASGNKKSLKKLEIEMGIHHQELGLPWNEPVPEKLWEQAADYCANDVIATEAAFNYLSADWTARQILADVADMTVNDTTNSLTARIIFGKNKHPQDQFNYRNLGGEESDVCTEDEWGVWNQKGQPVFLGYVYDRGKSTYRDEEVGEGGYVYAEPGMYTNVALLDIASMHPSSVIAENLFGDGYTDRFNEILNARIAIKHGDFDSAKKMLGGKLEKYLTDENSASALSGALKTAINSVYGLTAAHFDNPFHDFRNKDNIVAKRGALFMVNLKHEVQKRGYTVAHIKTDSIKIPNATPEIIQFVINYGKHYGYNFEHQATYEKMCLVNNAVYIARYANGPNSGKWTATGAQFAVPYVFKTLFSKENITLGDLCEAKEVKTELYLDMNEKLPDVSEYEKEFAAAETKFKHGELSDTTFEKTCKELANKISDGHSYKYIGKVGLFCPIKKGCGGGLLMRKQGDKYYAVTGTKGYRWLESEVVENLKKEDEIDRKYYDELVDEAVDTISKFGDFEWFVSGEPTPPPVPPDFMNIPEDADEEIPF